MTRNYACACGRNAKGACPRCEVTVQPEKPVMMRRPRIWKRDVPLQGFIDWLARFIPATATNGDGK